MKTDIQIAQEATMLPIKEVAAAIGITEDELEFYGKYKAKLSDELMEQHQRIIQDGKLILVTAINPTPAGEGKTTISCWSRTGIWQDLERKQLSHFVSHHLDHALVSRVVQPVADMHRSSRWRI